jgi:RNA polymerase-binding transcription factor DksA
MSTVISTPFPTGTAWARFRVLLEAQRADCVLQRELATTEAATAMPDPVAVDRVARLAQTIDEIDAALDRIADGSYGRCSSCGIAIPLERLEFRPFAAGCVACQASTR